MGNTNGDGIYIRKTTVAADKIQAWPDGTQMLVVGADQQAESKTWKNVEDPAGNVGWVPAEYLVVPSRSTTVPRTPSAVAQLNSTGLGIYCRDWEQVHGMPAQGKSCGSDFPVYENGRYAVEWLSWLSNKTAHQIERMWGDAGGVPTDTAQLEAKRLIPSDARFIRTYVLDDGTRVDVYDSAWLKSRIDPRFWFGSEPGTFTVIYEYTSKPVRGDTKAVVHTIIIGTGNMP